MQSKYEAKRDYFQLCRDEKTTANLTKREQSIAFLKSASGVNKKATDDRRQTLDIAKKKGLIDNATTDEDLDRHAERVGAMAQARAIIDNPPSHDSLMDFQDAYRAACDPRGATFTEKYGNLKQSAKKRSYNTGLSNASSLHHHRVSYDTAECNNERMAAATQKHTPSPPLYSNDEEARPPTRPDIVEVRKAAVRAIMSPGTDKESCGHSNALHTIQNNFQYPRVHKDLNMANDLLNDDGVAPKDRLDKLVRVVLARSSGDA